MPKILIVICLVIVTSTFIYLNISVVNTLLTGTIFIFAIMQKNELRLNIFFLIAILISTIQMIQNTEDLLSKIFFIIVFLASVFDLHKDIKKLKDE